METPIKWEPANYATYPQFADSSEIARKLAAFDDMLEALVYAEARLGNSESKVWDKVRAAIAKATQA